MTGELKNFKPKHFLWALKDKVGFVTINRPEKKNPLTFESYAELRDLFRGLKKLDEVRAIIISGSGGNFCSGGDVNEIIGPLTEMSDAELSNFTQMTGDLIKAMLQCPAPIISAVDGVCAGAGACVAMASDLRLATAQSKTAFLFVRVGLAGCDMGACALLPRIIGQGRAAELLYTGRSMSGEEGLAIGFFNKLAAPENLAAEALALAESIAQGPSLAHKMTKEMLLKEWEMPLLAAVDSEAEAQARCMKTADFKRAYAAFKNKEKPVFQGN